jgi:hypothetical protein
VKTHLTDASQPWGIQCNNPLARGPATPDSAQVTCQRCLDKIADFRGGAVTVEFTVRDELLGGQR